MVLFVSIDDKKLYLGPMAYLIPIWADKSELSGHNQRKELLLVLVFASKWWKTTQENIIDNSNSPHINFQAVSEAECTLEVRKKPIFVYWH